MATSSTDKILRLDLFNIWRNVDDHSQRPKEIMKYIAEKSNFDFESLEDSEKLEINKKVSNFCSQLQSKWNKSHRTLDRFLAENKAWLDGQMQSEVIFSMRTESLNVGRPRKSFAGSGLSSKRKKVQQLVQEHENDELCFATQISLNLQGKRDVAEIVKKVVSSSPKTTKAVKDLIFKPEKKLPTKMSIEEALALYVDNRFTKRQYVSIYQMSKAHNADSYPSYNYILQGKKECLPKNIIVNEQVGDVPLQSLIDHTIERLIHGQSAVMENVSNKFNINVLFKWGCDGAAGHSRYKQVFGDLSVDDSYMFILSLVPIQMTSVEQFGKTTIKRIIWNNPVPGSTKYCRPKKVLFKKETTELTKEEVSKMQTEIEKLTATHVKVADKDFFISSELHLTMLDGKICSTLKDESLQNCYICGATPKLMNNLESVCNRPIQDSNLKFGISPLHGWIKCFECLLHIAYRLPVKTWQVKGDNKSIVEARKKEIQEAFHREMGLLIDVPKPGFGSTNDGNTARRFFRNASLSAEITGLNEDVIKRFSVILRAISCGFQVDHDAFEKYCLETAELYLSEYSGYYMPQTVHKILVHGGQILQSVIVPVGQLSEEAQEARHKDSKYYRQFNTRKCSREKTMEDFLNMLLVSSDSLISSFRKITRNKREIIPNEVLNLLKIPEGPVTDRHLFQDNEAESSEVSDDSD